MHVVQVVVRNARGEGVTVRLVSAATTLAVCE